jgi:hypothetical protein
VGSITVAIRFPKGQRNITYTTQEVQRLGDQWAHHVLVALTSQTA